MNDDPAKSRFFMLQALRWSGLAMVLVGLLVLNGKIDLPDIFGGALVVVGLLDALIMPTILARRWKSPRQ
ncbi:MAG: hypothetical protein P8J20_04300 [Novosphingobium sp.]|nr:hypothetical protein [Novosphingobium sp.]